MVTWKCWCRYCDKPWEETQPCATECPFCGGKDVTSVRSDMHNVLPSIDTDLGSVKAGDTVTFTTFMGATATGVVKSLWREEDDGEGFYVLPDDGQMRWGKGYQVTRLVPNEQPTEAALR